MYTMDKLIEQEVYQLGGELYSKLEENHILSDLWGNLFLDDEALADIIPEFEHLTGDEQEQVLEEARDNNEDYQEIYEYWLVSKWLYEQLYKVGAPTLEYAGVYFYGRTETGQSLTMDHYLGKVVDRINRG